jgi:hypothetical protein
MTTRICCVVGLRRIFAGFASYSKPRWGHCAHFQAGYILLPQLSVPELLGIPRCKSRSGPESSRCAL